MGREWILTVATLFLGSCDLLSGYSDRSRITLEPADAQVMVGDTLWVEATVYDENGREVPDAVVRWERTDITVLGRDVELCCGKPGNLRARLTATGPGEAWLFVESGGHRDSLRVQVSGHELAIASVYSGSAFSCGLTEDGRALCWGPQYQRIPGAHVTRSYYSAQPIPDAVRFRSLSIGHHYACGLTPEDLAYCWGWHALGAGPSTTESQIPVPVAGDLRLASVAAGGFHACGLTHEGEAYCWGSNLYGQLGVPESPERCEEDEPCSTVPVAVAGGHAFRLIAPGGRHTCAIATTEEILCWGLNNKHELGVDAVIDKCGDLLADQHCSRTPVPVQGAPLLDTLVAGGSHNCGLNPSGYAYCWGSNAVRQLGRTDEESSAVVALVEGGHRFVSLSSTAGHTCGLLADGRALCWGANDFGQTGSEPLDTCIWGSTASHCTPHPIEVSGGLLFTEVDVGGYHTCGSAPTGTVYCWGWNSEGRLGIGDGSINRSALPLAVYPF